MLVINPVHPICEQKPNPLPDRKALDDIVFDILGLTDTERREVYWSVCELDTPLYPLLIEGNKASEGKECVNALFSCKNRQEHRVKPFNGKGC